VAQHNATALVMVMPAAPPQNATRAAAGRSGRICHDAGEGEGHSETDCEEL
jgi:hypothetical protein